MEFRGTLLDDIIAKEIQGYQGCLNVRKARVCVVEIESNNRAGYPTG